MSFFLFTLATLVATLAGGLVALRLRHRLPLVLGFTAGVLLGVVSFDLLPESFELSQRLGGDGRAAMLALVGAFLVFHGLDKFVRVHHVHDHGEAAHAHHSVGLLSAAALVAHSLMDGIAIGLAFQVSPAVGITAAIAVIAHDFCDGLNTVSLMLLHGNPTSRTLGMLALDAIAPVVGAASTLAFTAPPQTLVVYLGFFAGFLLHVTASDILPQAHARAGPRAALSLLGLTTLGASSVYVVVQATG